MNVICVAPSPIARGRHQQRGPCAPRGSSPSIRGRVAEARAAPAAGAGRAGGRASPATTPIARPSTPNDGARRIAAADDREVVDDRGDRRRGEPAAGVEDARRHRAQGQEDRAEQHDPGQLDGLVQLDRPEARGDRRHHDRRQDEQADRQDRQRDEHEVDDRRHDTPARATPRRRPTAPRRSGSGPTTAPRPRPAGRSGRAGGTPRRTCRARRRARPELAMTTKRT